MTVYRPRTRTISFRLSEAEYDELKSLSVANGSRSLSDFARITVRRAIAPDSSSAGIEARFRELKDKTEEIDRELGRLIRLVGRDCTEG